MSTIQYSSWRSSLFVGTATGTAVALVVFGTVLYTGAEGVPETNREWLQLVGWIGLGGILTAGVPVVLYLRYRLLSPILVLVVESTFWIVPDLVSTNTGDAPGYFFAVALWPVYLGLYSVAAALEYRLRGTRWSFSRPVE